MKKVFKIRLKRHSCVYSIHTVALIRTLAIKPDILLLDEAFSALDYETRSKVSTDVYNILRNENKSAIIITHDINEAIAFGDKVITLSSRPSIINNIYDIEINNNAIQEKNLDNKYNYYYNIISKDLII